MPFRIDGAAPLFVTGHRGLVGSAIVRYLAQSGFRNVLTAGREDLDLRNQEDVSAWFREYRPHYVIHAAGTVGGILANASRPAEFLYDNLMIHATVLRAACESGVEKLLYLGSSCIYPRDCRQPIREEALLSGPLEPTNEAYAIAKLAGVLSCQAYRRQYLCNFISAMPTNLYGPNDNFEGSSSHVLPALIGKFHRAKEAGEKRVTVWGSGTPRREFLHVDDLASACVHLMEHYDEPLPSNVGTGEDISIAELAELVREVVYPGAEISYDTSKPDGTPRKLLDVSRLHATGWRHKIELRAGVKSTYESYQQHRELHAIA